MNSQKRLMTLPDFSDQFSISRSAIYREVGAGRLKLTKLGRASRIAAADAEAWLEMVRSATPSS